MLSWVHIGDLHASNDDDFESLAHLESIVGLINRHLAGRVDFAYLPGDNANNGTPAQFGRIATALRTLRLPVHAIPGDHDFEPRHLDAFRAFAPAPLPMSRVVKGHRCLFLDVVSAGSGGPDFRLSANDRRWLDQELDASANDAVPPVVFMHAYPGDIADGEELAGAFARAHVAIVDTGHTHYNELLNDGWVVYAATRSTGQIEEDEGKPGFSVTAVDGAAVSWKFHPLDAGWPFVMITQPADRRLIRERVRTPDGPAAARRVRVLVSADDVVTVSADLDGIPIELARCPGEPGVWQAPMPAVIASERLRLSVRAHTADGRIGEDAIELAAWQSKTPLMRPASALGSDAHAVDAWPEHGILGSQLGPNKNGRHW